MTLIIDSSKKKFIQKIPFECKLVDINNNEILLD